MLASQELASQEQQSATTSAAPGLFTAGSGARHCSPWIAATIVCNHRADEAVTDGCAWRKEARRDLDAFIHDHEVLVHERHRAREPPRGLACVLRLLGLRLRLLVLRVAAGVL